MEVYDAFGSIMQYPLVTTVLRLPVMLLHNKQEQRDILVFR